MRNVFEINYKYIIICQIGYIKCAIVIVFFPEGVCYYYEVECPPNHSRLSCKQNLALLITLSNFVY